VPIFRGGRGTVIPPRRTGRHDDANMMNSTLLCAMAGPESTRGKIFHFVICHLAHIRVMCDCF
jgi:hypothetical protein